MTFSNRRDAHDTDYVTMLLVKEKHNPKIPLEIREYIEGKRQGSLSFGVEDLPSGGSKVTIFLR